MFADVYDIPGGSITLLAGQTVGLGTLWFDAPSERQVIQIVLDPLMISFAHDVNLYPDSQIQLVDGTLAIVPEPGTLSLLLMATALVGVGQSRHRRPARN
jgi:PEP-CTERM motif